MNLYLLVEGEQTEKVLYRSWIEHCFPQLKQARRIEDLQQDGFFIVSGMGYPSYLRRVPSALRDAARHGAVDHLLICVDAEETTRSARETEIGSIIKYSVRELEDEGLQYQGQIHIIVADCCMETWLLGHQKLVSRNPSSKLADFKRFYDVSSLDPEQMGKPSGYVTRASYHLSYVKAVYEHHGKHYSKTNPGIARELNYLIALRDRFMSTQHIPSIGVLFNAWKMMNATNI